MNTDLKTAAKSLLDLDLPLSAITHFGRYTALLLEWNERINLTNITDPDGIRVKHFLDSLSLLTLPNLPDNPRVIDIGSGAGLPGFALKFVHPEWRVTLMDATGKKVDFLEHVIAQLRLEKITAVQMRAEDAGQDAHHREKYDLVTARAVARMPILVEYMLPLCKIGGLCVAMKGESAQDELKDANFALQKLGGIFEGLHEVALPGVGQTHYLVCLRKVEATPPDYPRRAGLPSRKPLLPDG